MYYFWLCWVFVAVCGLSLVGVSRVYFLDPLCRPLIVVAFLIAEPRLSAHRLQELQHMGSVVATPGL